MLGGISADIKSILKNQDDHQRRDDARHTETQALVEELRQHVNHEVELIEGRLAAVERRLEHDEVKSKTRWGMIAGIGSAIASAMGLVVLFFSGALNRWFS